ncbi:glycosyltransferase family A protein [Flavobacterium sp. GT3P67]|uniref:glycosyltransferase family A protein n=1 Tax=Flavobacterium sp. GT3P67 TaxID=2541722 RepID=UPI00104B23D5|nr:glycosyltransferase family 2 protein [Flavobacterium sp. GT3P67]TDE53938.1 glycosyltransferase family 2 protein [Flavobacterium sp. GT3P67]
MLAIVIPYYKITFFEATLASLAHQTDKRFKVYIGNDASPESPSNLLEKYKGQFYSVYHYFDTNLGGISLVKQWNRCLEMIDSEEWVMFLGDDDLLEENVVSEFYSNLNEIDSIANVVRYSTCKINALGLLISSQYTHPKIEHSIDFFFRNVRSSLSEYIFRKTKMREIGFKDFPLAWQSDVLAVLEFSDFKNVYSINDAKVYIRITDLSISGKQDNLKLKYKAVFDFYYYLITYRLNHFNSIQKDKLYAQVNKSYLNDKKNITYFLKLSNFYLSKFLFGDYINFLKSIIINVLKIK